MLPENLPILVITAKCYLYSTHGIFIPAGGGCEDTDREGDPSGLSGKEKRDFRLLLSFKCPCR